MWCGRGNHFDDFALPRSSRDSIASLTGTLASASGLPRPFFSPYQRRVADLAARALNHYCTYFDSRYAVQGLALWLSLRRHDETAVLWVLGLDKAVVAALRQLAEPNLRVVSLAELETADPELVKVRAIRSWVEYVFTLSPCWPRFLLTRYPEIPLLTYVDADMAFFSSPAPLFDALGTASVLIVEHRFPPFLRDLSERGRFNVGVQCFRNDAPGRAVLADWRERCLDWCHDRVEPDRFADQKYLDAWPEKFPGVVICAHPGVNLAPWNWMNYHYRFPSGQIQVDGAPLVIFHFARFRILGETRADSGQLEYGVMPFRLRSGVYGAYWALLGEVRACLEGVDPTLARSVSVERGKRKAGRTLLLQVLFGPVWWRLGPCWISLGIGPGRFSGRFLRWMRRRVGRASGDVAA
jgi:hypothetical protein